MDTNVRIFPDEIIGKIKPLHGVGSGPVTNHFTFDATEEFRDAGIPFGRTHDIEYPFGMGEFIDIHCIFPDFDKDENDPKSYNFVFTDEYLKAMKAAGTEPFYRLGATIEHQPIKRYIFPPKDYEKWARVCSHIIAHYNEGWANGFRMGIRYWEIWNEPDIPQCWQGTQDEIFELYKVASVLLKKEHPEIKIGGLAITSSYSNMFEPFIKYVSENKLPIDFVSWHWYGNDPREFKKSILKAREIMDAHGLYAVESICNEWNYVCGWDDMEPAYALHKTAFGAAFMASVICIAHSSPIDKLLFYDAQLNQSDSWNNIFSPTPSTTHAAMRHVKKEVPYYVLWSWNRLYQAGNAIKTEADDGVYTAAARDEEGNIYLLIANYSDEGRFNTVKPTDKKVQLNMKNAYVYLMEDGKEFAPSIIKNGTFTLPGNRCAFVKIGAAK